MGRKRKLTAAEKQAKKERHKKYKWVMMNGKQVMSKTGADNRWSSCRSVYRR